jgi:glycosyltransferase involved in cell wall biosynthesis
MLRMRIEVPVIGEPAFFRAASPASEIHPRLALTTRRPSLTILTPLLNSANFFPATMRSVLDQAGDFDLQWIVIDGGSKDETLAQLRSIGDPRLQWISESDAGQAAAINKGLSMARGDIVAWLNGDDLYCPGALDAVAQAFEQNPHIQWLVGRCDIIDDVGLPVRQSITQYKNRLLDRYSLRSLARINMISQPAVFWRRGFGKSVGPLDESLVYTMDYDLWLRMAHRCPPLVLDQPLASFRVHTASKSRGGHREQFHEGYRVACRYQIDPLSRIIHRINVEKIVLGYAAFRAIGK